MHHIPRLSEAIYVGLCRKVGSLTEVRFRREVMDTKEMVCKPVCIMRGLDKMNSGSRREGFRLPDSDLDVMYWYPDHKVICDLSQISFYRIPQHTVILMDCDDLSPGFTRLNLMTPSTDPLIRSSCIMSNNEVFISSVLFRENHLRLTKYNPIISIMTTSPWPHGPCSTIILQDETEIDNAYCLQSQQWPTGAIPWIQRCRQQDWPSENIVLDILSGGFHVVPIGSTPENGEEWRISFSQAEQKIVYSMNHWISCLLLSQTLRPYLSKAILNRALTVRTEENSIISSTALDYSFFTELDLNGCIFYFEEFYVFMKQIEGVMRGKLTQYKVAVLQRMTSNLLRDSTNLIQEGSDNGKNEHT
ncbi:uncharacterized protein LOC133203247 [Saccostrea echinata]|uniref:uncharacterized protein LOC133203247 n=1 Tax=Saccostrea echinata TaxID=191078 RepID=UPI002A831A4D|nr:uncharacterized protein LOC133203247 [Saccostrea echinata]